jgi:hypothetical protein
LQADDDDPIGDINEMKGLAERIKSAGPELDPSLGDVAQRSVTQQPAAPPLADLRCEAWAANWDADHELDGLIVSLRPMSAAGEPLAIAGTLEVQLVAERPGDFPNHRQDIPRNRRIESIGRWTQSLSRDDFTGGEARLRVRFQAAHPQFTSDLGPLGAVHVRFSVPGQGVWQRTVEVVPLRSFSPLRDAQQQRGDGRFFAAENPSRSDQ